MEARDAFRKTPLLDACQVAPAIFEQVIPRLSTCMKPFVKIFHGQVDEQHATTSVCGLLSDVARKHIASIAYRVGQSRLPLQAFLGWHAWDDAPWRQAWRPQVKMHLGQGDGVLVCDPSGCLKTGGESVGVARQWGGRLGKGDHCHGALALGYVSRTGHTLVDTRLSLPTVWTKDKARLDKAGVPQGSRGYRTRHQLALEMLTKTAPSCRIAGGPVTTRGDAPSGFGVGWRPWGSGRRWRCRRIRRYVIWRSSPPSRGAGGVGPRVPGSASRRGGHRVRRRPGSGLMCAMGPKALWEWRR
jgi:DDE superfamily endonuclease